MTDRINRTVEVEVHTLLALIDVAEAAQRYLTGEDNTAKRLRAALARFDFT